jgi:hypothetical protein
VPIQRLLAKPPILPWACRSSSVSQDSAISRCRGDFSPRPLA